MNWEYLTLEAIAVEKDNTVLLCFDNDGEPLAVGVRDQDLSLLLPYSRIWNASQADPIGVEAPVVPVEHVHMGLKRVALFSRDGAMHDLQQLTQPDLVDTATRSV